MISNVEPTPSDEEREAILTALSSSRTDRADGGWAAAALLEGVDESESDHP